MALRSPRDSQAQQDKGEGSSVVTYIRRTLSGKNVNYSREDLDSEISSSELFGHLHSWFSADPDHASCKKPGVIINLGSASGLYPMYGDPIYSCSKVHQVGNVIESATELYTCRLTKKERKASLAEEILGDHFLGSYRGEFGKWIAFFAVVLRQFFPDRVPSSLEMPGDPYSRGVA